jgi:predicted permease
MIEIFYKTIPFFALIGLGYSAAITRFFSAEATVYLTKFVFYFALSAMLFRFSSDLSLSELYDPEFIYAYLSASLIIYFLATSVAIFRKKVPSEAAVEAQCSVIGNVGFLGIPMLAILLGPESVGFIMIILAIDLIVFGSLIVLIIVASKDKKLDLFLFYRLLLGLMKNPMIVSIICGLLWSASGWSIPGPINDFIVMLGSAATPGALFAIGASLAQKSTERFEVAAWLSFCKLVLHPFAVCIAVFYIFKVELYPATVMIAAASLPVAGNIFMVAQHYNVAPKRASAAIFLSTVLSIFTVSFTVAWVSNIN